MNSFVRLAAVFLAASTLLLAGNLTASAEGFQVASGLTEPPATNVAYTTGASNQGRYSIGDTAVAETGSPDIGLERTPTELDKTLGFPPSLVESLTRTKRLAVGVENGRLYYQLNGFDQDAVSLGITWGLAAAFCAIPAVGNAGCAGISLLLGAAALYISHNGKCSNNRELRISMPIGTSFRCV